MTRQICGQHLSMAAGSKHKAIAFHFPSLIATCFWYQNIDVSSRILLQPEIFSFWAGSWLGQKKIYWMLSANWNGWIMLSNKHNTKLWFNFKLMHAYTERWVNILSSFNIPLPGREQKSRVGLQGPRGRGQGWFTTQIGLSLKTYEWKAVEKLASFEKFCPCGMEEARTGGNNADKEQLRAPQKPYSLDQSCLL